MKPVFARWTARVLAAALVVVVVAGAAKLAWELTKPMLPGVIALAVVIGLYRIVLGRRHF